MYSFIEIECIFNNCTSCKELTLAQEAFTEVIKERDISNLKIFFIRKKARIRRRELGK